MLGSGEVLGTGDDRPPLRLPEWLRRAAYAAGAVVVVMGVAHAVGDRGGHPPEPAARPTAAALPVPGPVALPTAAPAPPSPPLPVAAKPRVAPPADDVIAGLLGYDAARIPLIDAAEALVLKRICAEPRRARRVGEDVLLGGHLVTRTYRTGRTMVRFKVSYQYAPKGVSYFLLGDRTSCGGRPFPA